MLFTTRGVVRVPAGLAAAALVSTLFVAACSDDEPGTPPPAAPPAQCPSTFAATAGTACTENGLVCTPDYACPGVFQQARCTCTGGSFVCTDATGATVARGGNPACVATPAPSGEACPGSLADARGKACSTPWRECTYAPACNAGRLDVCLCRPDENTNELTYRCEQSACTGDAGRD